MITKQKIKAVKVEIERLQNAIIELEDEGFTYLTYTGSKGSAQVKRASMDLSRALTELRRS